MAKAATRLQWNSRTSGSHTRTDAGLASTGQPPLVLGDPIRIAVALPVAEIDAVTARFDRALVLALTILSAGLIAASSLQVAIDLMPLTRLGRALVRVHSGASSRLEGEFPTEVRLLVDELNGVLGQQERLVERARSQAGDLAHGLKTSLQLLLVEADRLRGGQSIEVERIREPVLRMRTVIEHQLARVRAQTGAQARGSGAPVTASVDALVRVLGPVAAERGIMVAIAVDSDLSFAGDAADLEEMLGNLLGNACKWGRGHVRIAARAEGRGCGSLSRTTAPGSTTASTRPCSRAAHASTSGCPGAGWVSPLPATSPRSTAGGSSLDALPGAGWRRHSCCRGPPERFVPVAICDGLPHIPMTGRLFGSRRRFRPAACHLRRCQKPRFVVYAF